MEVKIRKVEIEKLKSGKDNLAKLQKQIEEPRILSTKSQDENEETEQYGCRLCLRVDRVPVDKCERIYDVLKKVISMYWKADLYISDIRILS